MIPKTRLIGPAHTSSFRTTGRSSCALRWYAASLIDLTNRSPSQDPTRPTIPKASLIYSFDRVFPPSTPQSSFFTTTTLPLVEKLLQGENGLLFAYGVSNSGKTYTISGGKSEAAEDRGLLPRAVDVVFNSIKGMENKANVCIRRSQRVVTLTRADQAVWYGRCDSVRRTRSVAQPARRPRHGSRGEHV